MFPHLSIHKKIIIHQNISYIHIYLQPFPKYTKHIKAAFSAHINFHPKRPITMAPSGSSKDNPNLPPPKVLVPSPFKEEYSQPTSPSSSQDKLGKEKIHLIREINLFLAAHLHKLLGILCDDAADVNFTSVNNRAPKLKLAYDLVWHENKEEQRALQPFHATRWPISALSSLRDNIAKGVIEVVVEKELAQTEVRGKSDGGLGGQTDGGDDIDDTDDNTEKKLKKPNEMKPEMKSMKDDLMTDWLMSKIEKVVREKLGKKQKKRKPSLFYLSCNYRQR